MGCLGRALPVEELPARLPCRQCQRSDSILLGANWPSRFDNFGQPDAGAIEAFLAQH
jgi:hypothetical protein